MLTFINSSKVAIFDFDGTLFDSAPHWVKVITTYLKDRGVDEGRGVDANEIMSKAKPLGITGCAKFLKEKFNLQDEIKDIVQEWRSYMGVQYRDTIALHPHAEEYIISLKEQGVKICLATAMERQFVEDALNRVGVGALFDYIVTIADVNADKSSPKIYLECAKRFDVAPIECVVFEDSVSAVKICKDAGFFTIGVHDGIESQETKELRVISDRFIENYDGLIK